MEDVVKAIRSHMQFVVADGGVEDEKQFPLSRGQCGVCAMYTTAALLANSVTVLPHLLVP